MNLRDINKTVCMIQKELYDAPSTVVLEFTTEGVISSSPMDNMSITYDDPFRDETIW